MEFDEDDFIFIESDAAEDAPEDAAEDAPEGSSPAADHSRASSARLSPTPDNTLLPSTADKPKLKRSFRTSPEPPGSPESGGRGDRKRRRKEPEPDSDEERWLDALQQGTLDEVDDELRKMRNPQLMTARQRAMLDKRSGDDTNESFPAEPLVALPTGYKDKAGEMTAEMRERHQHKVERRRLQAKQQREQEKKRTVSRLLTKSSDRSARAPTRAQARTQQPTVRYTQTTSVALLQLPEGVSPPLQPQTDRWPPTPRLCGVQGCSNRRRYCCSQTGVPLCSLECFRSNLRTRGGNSAEVGAS